MGGARGSSRKAELLQPPHPWVASGSHRQCSIPACRIAVAASAGVQSSHQSHTCVECVSKVPRESAKKRKTGGGRTGEVGMGMRRCASVARWALQGDCEMVDAPARRAGVGVQRKLPRCPGRAICNRDSACSDEHPQRNKTRDRVEAPASLVLPLRQPSRPHFTWSCGFASPDHSGFARSEVRLNI